MVLVMNKNTVPAPTTSLSVELKSVIFAAIPNSNVVVISVSALNLAIPSSLLCLNMIYTFLY